jgi:hypothetical protein
MVGVIDAEKVGKFKFPYKLISELILIVVYVASAPDVPKILLPDIVVVFNGES